ncbi:MAG TPA: PEGA domain-containing protein, partial [Candidatus Eisenbacteria bacterium]|nr:PEGA domain-containing protein [Candidatus Eisenbacteria bacterium]
PPRAAPPRPAPAPRGEEKKKPPLVPALIGAGVLLIAVVAFAIIRLSGGHAQQAESTPPEAANPAPAAVAPVTPSISPPPAPAESTAQAAAPQTPPLEQARTAFAAGDWSAAATAARAAITAKGTSRKDVRAARELLARVYVREKQPTQASQEYEQLLKASPSFKPDPDGLTADDRSAFETAKLNAAPLQKAAEAAATNPVASPAAAAGGATGTLVVHVKPFARLTVDGDLKGENQAEYTLTLKPGEHKVQAEHTLGTKDWNVNVEAGRTATLTWDFSGSAASISVTSDGGWGEIYLDGVKVGHTTPFRIPAVTPGTHQISLVHEGFDVVGGAQTVEVKPGQSASVNFKLNKKK